jgi:hypothetical protein
MKTTIAALVLVMTAAMAQAADLNLWGQTVSAGGEVDMNYTTGEETFALDFSPSAGINAWGVDFKASSTFDVLQVNEGDLFQGLEFEAGYTITTGLRAYAEVDTDEDFEFGNLTTGVSFAF